MKLIHFTSRAMFHIGYFSSALIIGLCGFLIVFDKETSYNFAGLLVLLIPSLGLMVGGFAIAWNILRECDGCGELTKNSPPQPGSEVLCDPCHSAASMVRRNGEL